MAKVSIVIAAYNVQQYIAATINSAIAQTLKDIEIVIVDDCSTDGTFEIISEYAELDKRIKVLHHKENQSVNITRTEGIGACTGEYIMLLDGDDTLSSDACEKAYNAITKEQVDMLQFNIAVEFFPQPPNPEAIETELRAAMYSANHKMISISKAGILDISAVKDTVSFQLWDKIYKRELLQKAVAFVPREYLNMAEDVLLSFFVQYHARSYSYIDDKLYNYRFGCGMSTVAKLNERLIKFIAKNAYVYDYIRKYVKKFDAETECKEAMQRIFTQLYTHISGVYFYRIEKEQRELFISEILKYTDPADLVLAFSNFIASNAISQENAITACAALDMFAPKKTEPKTVGVYYFRAYNGGVENVISSLSDIWVKAGYKVVLFTDEPPHKDDYYINPEIKRVVVPKMTARDFENRKERIHSFRKAIIENEIDVMVYNAWVSPDIVLDSMIIKSCGVNLIIHTHNLFCCETSSYHAPTALFFSLLPKLYSLTDSVITLTDVDTAWWEMMGARCFKTVNPIQFDLSAGTSALNKNNILFVGRLSGEKRVLDAIKIAELVQKEIPTAKLTVVGKGDDKGYTDTIDSYISENKLDGVVDMVGFKSDMLPYYLDSDVLLCTSQYEGFGLALMESKICGIPMVSYELPNLDIIRENKGMTVVDRFDIRAAADAIIKILKDNDLKKEMGKQARESAEKYLGIDLASHWKNIFEQTALPKPAQTPLRNLTAQDAAVRIAVDHYTSGLLTRLSAPHQECNQALVDRCEHLEREIQNIRRSETFRVGRLVTLLPRLLKTLIKKILGRK